MATLPYEQSALSLAVDSGPELVQLLLQHADRSINAQQSNGESATYSSIDYSYHPESVLPWTHSSSPRRM